MFTSHTPFTINPLAPVKDNTTLFIFQDNIILIWKYEGMAISKPKDHEFFLGADLNAIENSLLRSWCLVKFDEKTNLIFGGWVMNPE